MKAHPVSARWATASVLFLNAALLLLAACGPEPQQPHDPGAPDPCGEGLVQDTDGGCVPEACGVGTWGDLPIDGAAIFVDIDAEGGGDGSMEAPFTSIQAGLDAAGAAGGGTVAVAAGSYAETLVITWDHADVHLAGRCEDMVTIDASVAGEDTVAIDIEMGLETSELSGFTLTNAPYFGVMIGSGTVTLRSCRVVDGDWIGIGVHQSGVNPTAVLMEDCEIRGNLGTGTLFHDEGATVTVRDTLIAETNPTGDETAGYGSLIRLGASARFERCELRDNSEVGLFLLEGSAAQLEGCIVRDTVPLSDGSGGQGVVVMGGSEFAAEDCELAGNSGGGLLVQDDGTSVRLDSSVVRGNRATALGTNGVGIEVVAGAQLTATACTITDNDNCGVFVTEEGSMQLIDSTVSDNRSNDAGENGVGVLVMDGGVLSIDGGELSSNRGAGAYAWGPGSSLIVEGAVIRDTWALGDAVGGMALQAQEGAEALFDGCELTNNTGAAVLVHGEDTQLTLIGTIIQDTQLSALADQGYGLDVQAGAELYAIDCTLTDNSSASVLAMDEGTSVTLEGCTILDTKPKWGGEIGVGVHAKEQALVTFRDCALSGHTTLGAVAVDEGTTLELVNTRIEDTYAGGRYTAGVGASAQQGGTLIGSALSITGNDGPGLLVTTMGHASCIDCDLSDNAFAGAALLTAASLSLEGGVLHRNGPQENMGGGIGVYAETLHDAYPSDLLLEGTDIQDNPIAGVWLLGDGTYDLVDNDIAGGEGWERGGYRKCGDAIYASRGVEPWSEDRGLRLQGNQLHDSVGAGLFLNDASATLEGNSWMDNATDLITQGPTCGTSPPGLASEPLNSAELCPTPYDHGTCDDEFELVLELAELETGLWSPATPALKLSLRPAARHPELVFQPRRPPHERP
jgi:hypothetical protein